MSVRLRLSDTALDGAMLSIGAQGPTTRDYTRGMTSLHGARWPGTTWCIHVGDSTLLMRSPDVHVVVEEKDVSMDMAPR